MHERTDFEVGAKEDINMRWKNMRKFRRHTAELKALLREKRVDFIIIIILIIIIIV